MSLAQINVRMDPSLKEAGSSVITRLGYTPTQAIRALWEYAAVQGTLPGALVQILRSEKGSRSSDEGQPDGTALVAPFYERLGIPVPTEGTTSYEELRELAASEQLEKWGLR